MTITSSAGVFLAPKSVAVVGATPDKGKLASVILESMKNSAFGGNDHEQVMNDHEQVINVYAVNPKYKTIDNAPCYSSISDIGEDIDVAIFAVPAAITPGLLRDCANRIKGAVIIGGGFGEAGAAGLALEQEIKEIVRRTGVRVIGPNCMGIYDTISKLDTFFIPPERIKRPFAGGLSIISQSGSFAVTAMDELSADGIGVARVISYGNKADVNESDCLDMLCDDTHTHAVALYIESVDDGRRFVESARRCALKKPVMAVKVGKTEVSATAARSHTGAIAGRYEFYRAAFKKAGVIELNGYEDFMAACKVYGAKLPVVNGKRVMIITDGGGIGVALADECAAQGLSMPLPGAELEKPLGKIFPPYVAVSNPVDLTGSVSDEMYADALETAMTGTAYDMAIVAVLWGPPGLTDKLPAMLAQKAVVFKKPVIICSPGGQYTRERVRLFENCGLPVFPAPVGAVRAAALLAKGARQRQ
ncbi:CoA-binding protein [bacterium]|nr:MAG: CoA-binding protein [bacterium]